MGILERNIKGLLLVCLIFSLGTAQTKWSVVNSGYPDTTGQLLSIAYGNNKLVTVGWRIITSQDASTWSIISTYKTLRAVTFGNNQFVAGGGGMILTSSDGNNWSSKYTDTSTTIYSLTYGNNIYVAVGDSGKGNDRKGFILTSPTGQLWWNRISNTKRWLSSVTYAENKFVAVGDSGTIVTSPNGIDWTVANSNTNKSLYAVTYGNGKFVAVGTGGIVVTSSDASTWSATNSIITDFIYSITYGDNRFVAGGGSGKVFISRDAIAWTPLNTGSTDNIMAISYSNGLFVAVGDEGVIIKAIGVIPLLLTPTNNIIGISNTPELIWNSVKEAIAYELQISPIENFSSTLISQSDITDTSFVVSPALENNLKYYWRVRSNNGSTSDYSETRSFTTTQSTEIESYSFDKNKTFDYTITKKFFRYNLLNKCNVGIKLFNLNGELILAKVISNQNAGEHLLNLPFSATGSYILVFETDGVVYKSIVTSI